MELCVPINGAKQGIQKVEWTRVIFEIYIVEWCSFAFLKLSCTIFALHFPAGVCLLYIGSKHTIYYSNEYQHMVRMNRKGGRMSVHDGVTEFKQHTLYLILLPVKLIMVASLISFPGTHSLSQSEFKRFETFFSTYVKACVFTKCYRF